MARPKTSKPADSTAIGFKATALRDGASLPSEAFLRSLRAAEDNRWLAADKPLNNMVAALTGRSNKRRPQPEPYKHGALIEADLVNGMLALECGRAETLTLHN